MKRPTHNFESWLDFWKGFPCLILGRGKSTFDLPLEEIDRFREKGGKVIIVTELGRHEDYFGRADAWVFADVQTWESCQETMKSFPNVIWTTMDCWRSLGTTAPGPLSWVETADGWEFCPETPTRFNLGRTSSFLAAQLAWYSAANPIYFAGVDLRLLPDGRTHGDAEDMQYDVDKKEGMFMNQAKAFDNMKDYTFEHPNRSIHKTSDWSLLPFETKEL